jgi:predicted dehydrogenase
LPPVVALRRMPPAAFEGHFRTKYGRPLRKAAAFVLTEGPAATLRKARSKQVERRIEADQHLVIAVVDAGGESFIGFTRDLGGDLRFHPQLLFRVADARDRVAADALLERVEMADATRVLLESYLPVPSCPLDHRLVEGILKDNPWLAPWQGVAAIPAAAAAAAPAGPAPGRAAVRGHSDRPAWDVWLVGYGGYVREHILPAFASDVAAAVDYKAALIGRHVESPFPVVETLDEILPDIAAAKRPLVIVSAYHADHVPVAEAVLSANPRAGLFLEKPPCVTVEEARRLEALRRRGAWIDAGYNRRHAPFTSLLRAELQALPRPFIMTAEVKELKLPPSHWYFWPNQGTRVTGNLCHWLDLACHLADAAPAEIAVLGDEGNLSVTLGFADGSIATIVATDLGDDLHGVTERIQLRAADCTMTVDDFRSLEIVRGGQRSRDRRQHRDKGHAAMYRELRRRWVGGEPPSYPTGDIVRVAGVVAQVADMLAHGVKHAPLAALAPERKGSFA